jgi:hypothetical protein
VDAHVEKLQVGFGRQSQFRVTLDFNLLPKPRRHGLRVLKPRGVEDLQIVGVDGRLVAPPERVVGEPDRQRSAAGQRRDVGHDRGEVDVVAEIAVDGVQTRRTARRSIGLGRHLEGQV